MPKSIYWIAAAQPHQLAIVARPRGNDWLEGDIESLVHEGIDVLVSLLTHDETVELGLSTEVQICSHTSIQFLNLPIEDRSVPGAAELRSIVDTLVEHVLQGRAIGFHCRAGIGRSSMVAAVVLARLGWTPAAAFQAIGESRGCTVPDTLEQKQWVRSFVQTYPR